MRKARNSAAAWKTRGVGRLPSVPAEPLPSPTCEQIPSMTSLKARAEKVVSKLEAARCQLEVSALQARELRAQTRQETWGLRHAGMKRWILMMEIKRSTLLGEELCEAVAPEPASSRRACGLRVQ
ncbi:MAG: hypothetical protein WBV36_26325 [Terriglobales bacterium]